MTEIDEPVNGDVEEHKIEEDKQEEEQKQEVIITNIVDNTDNNIEEAKPIKNESGNNSIEEAKPIKKENRRGHKPKMSESKKINVYKKEECPDCKKLLTIGNLRYKHGKFCVGKKIKASNPIQPVEHKPPPITESEIVQRVEQFNKASVEQPQPPQIDELEIVRNYISRTRQEQIDKKTQYYNALVNKSLRRRF
jgi:hypothetical protein